MKVTCRWISRFLPFLVIALAYLWALGVVGIRTFEKKSTGRKVISIAHWQLEAGVRDGLDEAARAYEKLHPDVEIRQEAIPESGYGQWLSVQLLGSTAPDIVEMGALPYNLLVTFYQRYIVPLTPFVTQPNPYNSGTDLENTPYIHTFMDDMRGSFINETQEYMTVPMTRTSIRLIYNKDLLKKLTGSAEAPTDFRGFLAVCGEIELKTLPDGQRYTPISCSQYHLQGWTQSLFLPATYDAFRKFDFNYDGIVGGDEWAVAYLTGRISFDDPAYRRAFALMKEFTRYCQPGWTGLQRDEAVFKFAQQKAVFISSGLWELGGLQQLAAGKFELGILDFPLPKSDDPEFGGLIQGPRYENPAGMTGGNVAFAITKTSRHQEIARDFLLFLTSREENEKFNKRLNWLPVVVGAKSAPELKPFEPTLLGVFPAFYPTLGGASVVRWQQLLSLFLVDQLDYSKMSSEYADFYKTKGREDFDEYLRNMLRGQTQQLQLAAGMRAIAIANPNDSGAWTRYRAVAMSALDLESSAHYYQDLVSNPDRTKNAPLYRYSAAALARLHADNSALSASTRGAKP